MNEIREFRRPLARYIGIDTYEHFQERLFRHALDRYQELCGAGGLGSVAVTCGMVVDAVQVTRYPFDEILITGLGDQRQAILDAVGHDPRIRYQEENAESLTLDDASFDLVFCKFGLHHLARPTLGVYEMLRCCRRATVFIEPYDSPARRLLERVQVASVYERKKRNPGRRDNYVYPFSRRQLINLLNSYYLDSGYRLELHYGWYSDRSTWRLPRPLRPLSAYAGWLLQYAPGAAGNLLTALICPGTDRPRPIFRLGVGHSYTDLGL